MKLFNIGLLAATLLTASLPSEAQSPATPLSPSDERIVITAPRALRSQIHSFVTSIAEDPAHQLGPNAVQMARFDSEICPGIFGLANREHAQFIADQIARRAFNVGLHPASAGCRPNIAIFVTNDSTSFIEEMTRTFFMALADGNHPSWDEYRTTFHLGDQPVKWWHVAYTTGEGGGRIAPGQRIWVGHPTIIQAATRQDIGYVIVVVDTRRVGAVRLGALADYLSMVSLAQLNPNADTRAFPTILNLFKSPNADRPRPEELSSWDEAYLQSLYHMQRNAIRAGWQRGEIGARMRWALEDQAAEPTPPPSPSSPPNAH